MGILYKGAVNIFQKQKHLLVRVEEVDNYLSLVLGSNC